ncbi:potassium-transporting ATPase subunit KdpA [Acidisoma sp. C75]
MTVLGWAEIALFFLLVILITRPVGALLARLSDTGRALRVPVLGPIERGLYRAAGVDPAAEQSWVAYATAMLAFKLACFLAVYAILRLQSLLPLNPDGQGAVPPALAYNTAVSFLTNTNWQFYGGETTLSYFSQMVALAVQNFTSAAAGIAIALAVIRGFSRRSAGAIGNFWADLVRITVYALLPLSLIYALFLVWQGVPQTFHGAVTVMTLEGSKQTIALGPVASQEAIKMLGTNGGGFFNANSAHPFENPTALTNFIEAISIFVFGAGLTNAFGRLVGDERQGWAIFAAMGLMFLVGVSAIYLIESGPNPILTALHVAPGMGNMEGKEIRFGMAGTAIFSTATTDASCGAVDAMFESFLPLGGMVPMINMMLGEIIYGGVGSGLYGFLLFAILAVFIAGLMVGRTPEYLGKKIEAREIKLTMLAVLCLPLVMLGFTALAVVLPVAKSMISASGPHGFSEALYAYVSAAANNGSAFAGLSGNDFWDITMAIGMMIGRFFVMVPALAIAGALAAKKTVPQSSGSFPTTGPLFIGLVIGVILILGGLVFFPALALGPIAEHFAMLRGTTY